MATPKLFTLEGKGLKLNSEADIEPHIKELKEGNHEFEEIRLQGNTIGVDASKALASALSKQKNLQVRRMASCAPQSSTNSNPKIANLADIFTGRLLNEIPAALEALLTALLTLPQLHTINLSDNAFGFNTQAPLIAFLSAHTPLRHLILTNNGLGPEAGAKIAAALTTLAARKKHAGAGGAPKLETVVCGRNRLENGSMAAWAGAYAAHAPGLVEVKMVQNGIRQEGVAQLLRTGLVHATGLRVLDLQDNTFTAMGARALSEVVGGWSELRVCVCVCGGGGVACCGSWVSRIACLVRGGV